MAVFALLFLAITFVHVEILSPPTIFERRCSSLVATVWWASLMHFIYFSSKWTAEKNLVFQKKTNSGMEGMIPSNGDIMMAKITLQSQYDVSVKLKWGFPEHRGRFVKNVFHCLNRMSWCILLQCKIYIQPNFFLRWKPIHIFRPRPDICCKLLTFHVGKVKCSVKQMEIKTYSRSRRYSLARLSSCFLDPIKLDRCQSYYVWNPSVCSTMGNREKTLTAAR